MKPSFSLFLCFLVCFLTSFSVQAAQTVSHVSHQTITKEKKTKKLAQKILKKTPQVFAKKYGGYEAMFYVLLLMLIDLLLLILFILSLIFSWKILAWVLGIVLGVQLFLLLLVAVFGK